MGETPNAGRTVRGLLTSAAAVMGGVIIAVIATSGSYAYLSDEAGLESATITAGTTGLLVEGASHHAIPGMDVTGLVPGTVVYTAFTVSNSGDVDLSVAVGSTQVTAATLGLADHLTASLAPVATPAQCTASVPGAVVGPLPGFTSTRSPVMIPAGYTQVYCLAVSLVGTAPSSVQGGTAAFVFNFDGIQVTS